MHRDSDAFARSLTLGCCPSVGLVSVSFESLFTDTVSAMCFGGPVQVKLLEADPQTTTAPTATQVDQAAQTTTAQASQAAQTTTPKYPQSQLPGCPLSFVSCGYCPCVPDGICQFCGRMSLLEDAGTVQDTPAAPAPLVQTPSTLPGCPQGFVNCGKCMCVPGGVCASSYC